MPGPAPSRRWEWERAEVDMHIESRLMVVFHLHKKRAACFWSMV